MMCEDELVPDPHVTVVFKDAAVLLERYLLSFAGQDILELILENDVHLEGKLELRLQVPVYDKGTSFQAWTGRMKHFPLSLI